MRLKNIHVPPNLIPLEKKRRQKKRQKADYKKREGERVTEKEEWRRGEARRMEAIVSLSSVAPHFFPTHHQNKQSTNSTGMK